MSVRERKMERMGSWWEALTLKACKFDKDHVLFDNETEEVLGLVLLLNEAMEGRVEGGGKTYVIDRAWVMAVLQFSLGIALDFPGALDNGKLLKEENTLVGKTWIPKEFALSDEPSPHLTVNQDCWSTILKLYPGSGPTIVELEGGKLDIDEGFMLRKYVGANMKDAPEHHDDEAAVTFFTSPISKKRIEEKSALDGLLKREQGDLEGEVAAMHLLSGIARRRKSNVAGEPCAINDIRAGFRAIYSIVHSSLSSRRPS